MGTTEGYGSRVIVTTPLPTPPVLTAPAAHEVSYGLVRGTAAPGSQRVIVRVNGRLVAKQPLAARRFVVDLDLPFGEHVVVVETFDASGRAARRTVADVYGLPRAARPREQGSRLAPALQNDLRRLARGFGSSCAFYVQDLATGAGAAWNARAEYPAASTLKLAVAVTALARFDTTPTYGSVLDGTFRSMLDYSDNGAANRLEVWFGGSTSGGSHLVNETMESIGLTQTDMYGGYLLDSVRATSGFGSIPLTTVEQPSWGRGKRTTAFDLARLSRAVWLASGGLGPLRRSVSGFSAADGRYLLRLLADVHDHDKLDRALPAHLTRVIHKAGWIDTARHDNGIVFWRGGVFVATVMTYRSWGVGTSSDVLAGQVALAAFRRFR